MGVRILALVLAVGVSVPAAGQHPDEPAEEPATAASGPVDEPVEGPATVASSPRRAGTGSAATPRARRLEVSGSWRFRPETRRDVGFDPRADEAYVLSRLRVRLTARLTDTLLAVAEMQDSRSPGLAASRPSLRDPADLHQGYVDIGAADGAVRARVGRQEMPYGAERILSRNNWRNTGRSFDAVRLFLRRRHAGLDLFGAAEVRREPAGLNPFHELGDLYGAYGWLEPRTGVRVESYLLRRSLDVAYHRGEAAGPERRRTIGVRVVRQAPTGLDLVTEAAWQGGRSGPGRIGAWFGSVVAAWTIDAQMRPSISVEFTEASGDRDAADGLSATFDPMYPTGHQHSGFADLFSARNLREMRVGFAVQPTARTSLRVDVRNFDLSTPGDGLYAPSLRQIVPSHPGGRATRVGVEVDLTLRVQLNERLLLGGGYGHLAPGAVIRERTPGGVSRYPYGFLVVDF